MANYSGYSWDMGVSDSTKLAEREKARTINGVRIQPGCMIFKDAYDGKSYNQSVTITNCSKNSVNIRIFPPTSKTFQIKPMPIGQILSSGLSIARRIKYLYTKPTAIPRACMDIYINNECVRYELIVVTCYTQVTVIPKILDFGDIDLGMVSEVKTITIRNTGTKQAQYSTDLGPNQLEIIVEPMKGTVQPGESKEMTVEVFGTAEGEFNQEFWIKSNPLQRVQIQGHFIQPSLQVNYPVPDKNLVILNFPKTFPGVRRERSLVIQNHSSTSAVFCVNGRIKTEKLPYKDAMQVDINLKQFEIWPLEGRLRKDQKYIMRVTFVPEKPKNGPKYYIGNVIVDVMKCRADGNPCASHNSLSNEQNQNQIGVLLDSLSASIVTDESNGTPQEITILDDMVTIVLYGEVELPDITIQPDKIIRRNLKIYETYFETLEIVNNSNTLPLILKYNKTINVEMEPTTIHLPPSETVEVTLKLRPTKMGHSLAKVVLDVYYKQKTNLIKLKSIFLDVLYSGDYTEEQKATHQRKPSFLPGITPKNCNEVGYLVDDVRFNTKIDKPITAVVDQKLLVFNKNNQALIALPNDRPRVLKPWKNPIPCKTIFAQLPRLITEVDVDYDLTTNEQILRNNTRSYYENYIRSLAKKNKQAVAFEDEWEEYMTTNRKRVLMEHLRSKAIACPSVRKDHKELQSLFVPLTPYEVHNIVVSPKFIQLGKLAANSERSDHFNIENKNAFPIHLSIKALYSSIRVVQEEFILGPGSQKDIDFVYHSDNSGTHHIPMFIILNFFHVFDVTVLAKIVANTVKCINKDITIVPTEKTAFLELKNPINSDVGFEIDTNFFLLESFPSKGVIPAKRNITLTVTFNPEVGFSPIKEIAVISESGFKELVEVNFDHKRASVSISSDTLTFQDVPLNTAVTQELIILNNSDQLVPLNIELNNELIPELTISPMKALILQKGDIAVTFTVKFREVVEFTVPVEIKYQYQYSRNITVKGNVVTPSVTFRPELIKIPKIPSGSMIKAPFRLFNNSEVPNYLLFPLNDYPEFVLRTKSGENVTSSVLHLPPKERRDLLLEFQPHEPVVYSIYLPYILNEVIGPPELNCPDTLLTSYYMSLENNEYKTCPKASSEKLRALKIICAASTSLLRFSTMQLEFSSLGRACAQDFEVTNISSACQEVSLKVADVESFVVNPVSDNTYVEDDVLKAMLEPQDSFLVTVEFMPVTYGKFAEDMPIFVKDYSETNPFNYLKLTGDNPAPRIVCSTKSIYFIPSYVGCRQTREISLTLIGHRCDKVIEVSNDISGVDVAFARQSEVSDFETIVYYVVTFVSREDCTIESEIRFSCSCSNADTRVEVFACCDSAIVINFMSDASCIGHSTYPLFPLPTDRSNYAELLRTVLAIIERWMYTQGFFYQNYYKIPDDIARYPVQIVDSVKPGGGKKTCPQLPLVQLLVNLMDNSILKYIETGIAPSQILEKRTVHNYATYKNTVIFLKSQGIHVPGLKPEHLLAYCEYVVFKTNLEKSESKELGDDYDEATFFRFSKQKWLDLFFHIYKVLVQERVVNPGASCQEIEKNAFVKQDAEEFEEYFQTNLARFPDWFLCDSKLLLWLEYHYDRQKTVLWPKDKFEGLQLMDDICDVDDGVSLATVTAAYCPYLQDQLKDVYAYPTNLEQKVHNACKVVQSWKSLKLSFDVHPQTIVLANRIKIILIATYLYEVLPHFFPTEEVTIEAPLSESASYSLSIQNCGNVTIQYTAIFFGKSSNLFTLDNNSVVIPNGKSKHLKLTYYAKKVLDASAILVLSGETGGQRYAKSMAVNVTGVPKTTSSDQIKMQVEIYRYMKKKISIKTPYAKNYRAKIFLCFDEPKSYKDLHSVSVLKTQHIPRELDVLKSDCEFVDKGEATITLATCFLSQGPTPFYLYFCNDDIGDFCVFVNLMANFNKSKAPLLNVDTTSGLSMSCTCHKSFNRNCPKVFTVSVPSKNDLLWNCAETLIQKCLADSTVRLLKQFFGTPVVFRLMKFYLERFPRGYMLSWTIFDDQAEFVLANNKNFTMPLDTLKIVDVASDGTVPLLLHLEQSDYPTELLLELKSLNEKEIRCYKLIFPLQQQSDSLTTDSSRQNASVGR